MRKPAKRSSASRPKVQLDYRCLQCGSVLYAGCPKDVEEHGRETVRIFLESIGWRQMQEGWKCGECTGIQGDVGKQLLGMNPGTVHVVVDPKKGDVLQVKAPRRRPLLKKRVFTAEEIRAALRAYRFRYSTEKDLQAGIQRALQAAGIVHEREWKLGGDLGVVDFMVGRIAVEIKTKGSPSQVARQLIRYCKSEEVDAIILVTGKSALGTLPETLNGKPVYLLALWGTFL